MAGMVLQGVLSLVLLGRKAWRHFPVFTSYALFSFIMSVSVYLLQHQPKMVAFYSYWICEAITIVLGFGVVYEVFRHLFSNYKSVLKQARLGLRWTFVAFFCVALYVILVQAPPATIRNGVLIFEEAIRVVELGLLIFLFAAALALGLHWRQAEFGIALGLGFFVAIELATVALRNQAGCGSQWQALNVVRILSFDTSLLVWLVYLLAPERGTGGEPSLVG